jgi:hypothetical protein
MMNSKRLTGNRPDSSDNDPRFGRRNSSNDDLRADAAVTRPSPAFPLEGRGQAIKAEEPEARSGASADDIVGRETFSGCCHQHRTNERRPSQSAPTGPHSRPRRGSPRTRTPPSRRATCWATLWRG